MIDLLESPSTSSRVITFLLALVIAFAFLSYCQRSCEQTTCKGGLKPVFVMLAYECLCVGEKEK
ncbi:MAG TPA: hypothetical protein PK472_11690 [Pseudomonadota bacterium]|nr:hypothetical protein [Pseudomonadota bacterium]